MAFRLRRVQRGISLNGADITISNSHISEIHGRGYDTQAICGWNGPGPFRIINNYLEAAGENVMFGGCSAFDHQPRSVEHRDASQSFLQTAVLESWASDLRRNPLVDEEPD